MVRSVKGLITSLGLKNIVSSNKYKNANYIITNVSMKNLSKIIRYFESFPCESNVRKIPKNEPNDSYFLYMKKAIYVLDKS